MLGPVRFDHIKNCAREAISKHLNSSEQQVLRAKKARTVVNHDEEKRRGDLIRVLPERDRSISVLRGLLAEKQLAMESSSPKGEKPVSPAKVPEYAKLPLNTLENLERARDATIGWILAQIEKVEVAQTGQKAETGQPAEIGQKVETGQKAEIPPQPNIPQQPEIPQPAEIPPQPEIPHQPEIQPQPQIPPQPKAIDKTETTGKTHTTPNTN